MKQNTFNWLSYSLLILLLVGCKKKEKGFFDDFPPGKFDFVWITEHQGIKDTLEGEVSGPYSLGGAYFFRKHLVNGENKWSFIFYSRSNGTTIDNISIYQTQFDARIVHYTISENNLALQFNKKDTLLGSFNLIRK